MKQSVWCVSLQDNLHLGGFKCYILTYYFIVAAYLAFNILAKQDVKDYFLKPNNPRIIFSFAYPTTPHGPTVVHLKELTADEYT